MPIDDVEQDSRHHIPDYFGIKRKDMIENPLLSKGSAWDWGEKRDRGARVGMGGALLHSAKNDML